MEWCGRPNIGAAYSDSHLKTLLETSDIPKLVTTFVPRLSDRIEKEKPGSGPELIKSWAFVQTLWIDPTAIYVAARRSDDDAAPMRFELLCDAGDQIDAVRESFDAVAQAWAGRIHAAAYVHQRFDRVAGEFRVCRRRSNRRFRMPTRLRNRSTRLDLRRSPSHMSITIGC